MSRLEDEVAAKLAGRKKLREAAVAEITEALSPDELSGEIRELLGRANRSEPLGELEAYREKLAGLDPADLARRIKERAAAMPASA